jgi:hypothetical protein
MAQLSSESRVFHESPVHQHVTDHHSSHQHDTTLCNIVLYSILVSACASRPQALATTSVSVCKDRGLEALRRLAKLLAPPNLTQCISDLQNVMNVQQSNNVSELGCRLKRWLEALGSHKLANNIDVPENMPRTACSRDSQVSCRKPSQCPVTHYWSTLHFLHTCSSFLSTAITAVTTAADTAAVATTDSVDPASPASIYATPTQADSERQGYWAEGRQG